MTFFNDNFLVWIIRNADTAGEEPCATRAGGSPAGPILLRADVRLKKGDWLKSELWDEPRVATHVDPVTDVTNEIVHWRVEIVPLSDWREQRQLQTSSIHQTVYGSVGTMVGRDLLQGNTTVVTILSALEKAVTEAEITPEEKESLLGKIRDLMNSPWTSGIGAGLAAELLKKAAGLG